MKTNKKAEKNEKELGKEQYNIFADALGVSDNADTNDDTDEIEDTVQFEEGMKRFNEDGEEDSDGKYDDEGREIVFEETVDDDDGGDDDTVEFKDGMKRFNDDGEEDDEGEYDDEGRKIIFKDDEDKDKTVEFEDGMKRFDEDGKESDEGEYDGEGRKIIFESDDDWSEKDVAALMADTFKEKTGIDINEDRKFETVDDFVDLMRDVIDANSEPKYSSKKVKEIDEYIKNGGKLEDFLNTEKKIVSLEDIDLDNENDQKSIIRRFYEDKGLSDKKIERLIDTMDDEELEEESKELHKSLLDAEKNHKKKEKENKEKQIERQREAQDKFVNEYNSFVDDFDKFNGIKMSNKDKENILNYVVGVDKKTGKTYSQLDFDNNPYEVLAQLAMIRTKKDLFSDLGKKAETDAVKKFRNKLRKNSSKQKSKSDKSKARQRSPIEIIQNEARKVGA